MAKARAKKVTLKCHVLAPFHEYYSGSTVKASVSQLNG